MSEESPASKAPAWWWIPRLLLYALAVLAAVAVAENLRDFPRTEDAEVRANVAGVAAQVGGTITRIAVRDNEEVARGQVLLELDARPYLAEMERAAARLELVRLEVRALRDAIAEAEAAVARNESLAAYATAHYERVRPLLQREFFSADRVEKAGAEAAAANARLAESRAALERARNELGEIDGSNARINEAAAALADAELKASFCKVPASTGGRFTNLQISPGSYAAAGEQLFSIVDTSEWFVLANFRETDLSRIRPGQEARIFLMSRWPVSLRGMVEGIAAAVNPLTGPSAAAPGSGGVLQRVEPTFDFIQLAARFPVRIAINQKDACAHAEDLRMGGRAAVIVNTRDRSAVGR